MKHKSKWSFVLSLALSLVLGISGVCYADGLVGAKGETMWDEEYTDTDTGKGTLAVRCQVFQGFQGAVTIYFTGLTGGRAFTVSLDKDVGYIANLSLAGERYKVTGVTAISELREYDCHVEPDTVCVEAGRISICKVFVNPGSVQKFPEETETLMTEQAEKQEIIERKKQEEQIKPDVEEEMLRTEPDRRQIPVLGILGMALILICAGSLFYLRKQDK